MNCPKCKHVQVGTIECESCGIVFEKYYQLIIRRKFDQALQKYNEKEYQAALDLFNAIVKVKIPKDDRIVEQCKDYILKIDELLSVSKNINTMDGNISKPEHDDSEIKEPTANTFALVQKIKEFQKITDNKKLLYGLTGGIIALILVSSTIFFISGHDDSPIVSGSFDQVSKLAEKGNVRAQYTLGLMYYEGKAVAKNLYLATEWFDKAANKGDGNAQYHLGIIYEKGEGVTQDKNKAEDFFTKAAKYYIKFANKGIPDTQYILGMMYSKGQGVTKDIHMAANLWIKAADKGNPKAQVNLGFLYYYGIAVNKDIKKCLELYEKSADQGYAEGQFYLGTMYFKGEGVTQNFDKALDLFNKSSDQGFPAAQSTLGGIYSKGEGVTKDLTKAVDLYSKAADQGYASAQYALGIMYYNGNSVSRNLDTAEKWCTKAAEQGDSDAKECLKMISDENKKIKTLVDEMVDISRGGPDLKAKRIAGEAQCEQDCAVNKYQYDTKCKYSCMKAKGYW